MKSAYDLLNVVNDEGLKYFGFDNDAIYIKSDPSTLSDESIQVRYLIDYKYIPEEISKDPTQVRIMAVMNTDDDNITPKLFNYTLRME